MAPPCFGYGNLAVAAALGRALAAAAAAAPSRCTRRMFRSCRSRSVRRLRSVWLLRSAALAPAAGSSRFPRRSFRGRLHAVAAGLRTAAALAAAATAHTRAVAAATIATQGRRRFFGAVGLDVCRPVAHLHGVRGRPLRARLYAAATPAALSARAAGLGVSAAATTAAAARACTLAAVVRVASAAVAATARRAAAVGPVAPLVTAAARAVTTAAATAVCTKRAPLRLLAGSAVKAAAGSLAATAAAACALSRGALRIRMAAATPPTATCTGFFTACVAFEALLPRCVRCSAAKSSPVATLACLFASAAAGTRRRVAPICTVSTGTTLAAGTTRCRPLTLSLPTPSAA